MSKKLTTALVGQTFKLLPSLLDISGEPHPYAGQEITVIDRTSKSSFQVSTPDDTVIVVRQEDWGPTDAEMQKIIAAPALSEQLATINLFTDPKQNTVQQLLLGTLRESPFNPRTNYPEADMQELAESARTVGIMQPVLVRPRGDGSHELVFGHRRHRAAKMAGLEFIPAIVRELTDAQSAQLQSVENVQRKDLDAIDEALGYAAFIATHGISKDELARQIGKSRTHIYNRLKLATLHAPGQAALRSGQIRAEVATLIARIPGEKHQAQALKMVLDNTASYTGELLPVRKARDMLAEKFALDLKGALWALDDATLVESAGACTICPKRSGFDPIVYVDLLGDPQRSYQPGPKGENVCTDPLCFDSKKTAQLKANQAALEAKGKTVIFGNAARKVVDARGNVKDSYVTLKEVREAARNAATTGKGAPAINVASVTIQNPRDGKTIDVVKRADAEAAGLKIASSTERNSNSWQADEHKRAADRAKREAIAKLETAVNLAILTEVRKASTNVERCTLDMQLIAQVALAGVDYDDKGVINELYGATDLNDLRKKVGSMPTHQLSQLLLDCALAHNVIQQAYGSDNKPTPLLTAAKHYGIDVAAIRKAHTTPQKPAAAPVVAA